MSISFAPNVGPAVGLLLEKNLSQVFAFTQPGVKVPALHLREQGQDKPFISVPLGAVGALCAALREHRSELPEIEAFADRLEMNARMLADSLGPAPAR